MVGSGYIFGIGKMSCWECTGQDTERRGTGGVVTYLWEGDRTQCRQEQWAWFFVAEDKELFR